MPLQPTPGSANAATRKPGPERPITHRHPPRLNSYPGRGNLAHGNSQALAVGPVWPLRRFTRRRPSPRIATRGKQRVSVHDNLIMKEDRTTTDTRVAKLT